MGEQNKWDEANEKKQGVVHRAVKPKNNCLKVARWVLL